MVEWWVTKTFYLVCFAGGGEGRCLVTRSLLFTVGPRVGRAGWVAAKTSYHPFPSLLSIL